MVRSILVPISQDDHSHLGRAIWLARRSGAQIILLGVGATGAPPVWHVPDDVRVRTLAATGEPAREILHAARREQADLIVMGLDRKWHMEKGWSEERAFQRFLRKSTVAHVVQEAPCPVWLDKPSRTGSPQVSGVACFLHRTRNCESLVRFAARLSETFAARPLLFHATVSTHVFGPGQSAGATEMQRAVIEIAERRIAAVQESCGTAMAVLVAAGDDVSSLDSAAGEWGAELIVTARISRRWGDNAKIYQIVRHCRASVLIQAGPETAFAPVQRQGVLLHPLVCFLVVLAAMVIGMALTYLAVQSVLHMDLCHLASIRCQIPVDFLFAPEDFPD